MSHKDVVITPVWDCTEEEWLLLRDKGLGGSDAGTVVGPTRAGCPRALFQGNRVGEDRSGGGGVTLGRCCVPSGTRANFHPCGSFHTQGWWPG